MKGIHTVECIIQSARLFIILKDKEIYVQDIQPVGIEFT